MFVNDYFYHFIIDDLYLLARDTSINWDADKKSLEYTVGCKVFSLLEESKSLIKSIIVTTTKQNKFEIICDNIIKNYTNMVISMHDLFSCRNTAYEGNETEYNTASEFYEKSVSSDVILAIMMKYKTSNSPQKDHRKYCYGIKRMLEDIMVRNSSCSCHVPPLWIRNAKEVYSFYKLRAILMKIIDSLPPVKEHYVLLDIAYHVEQYYLQFINTTHINIDGFEILNIGNIDVSKVLLNIKTIQLYVQNYGGLNSQMDLLCRIEKILQERSIEQNAISLDEKSLLEPSFVLSESNYQSNKDLLECSAVKRFLNNQFNYINTSSVTSVSHEVSIITVSCDDVELVKRSSIATSVFVLECFFAGAPFNLQHTGKNCWFSCLVPVTKQRELLTGTACQPPKQMTRASIRRFFHEIDNRTVDSAVIKTITDINWDNSPMNGLDFNSITDTRSFSRSQMQVTPSNWLGRQVTNVLINDFKLLGDRGIVILDHNTIHFVKPAIIGFRFDNPAGDLLANSSKKQSSNQPCRDCDITMQYWNQTTNMLSYADEWDIYDDKDNRKVFFSSLSLLERDDLLRIIPLVNLFSDGDEPTIATLLDDQESCYRDQYLINELSKLLTICKNEQTTLWTAPISYYCPPKTEKYGYKGTNPEFSIGKINLDNLICGFNSLKSKDYMHYADNKGKDFKSIATNTKEKKEKFLIPLNKELQKDFIIAKGVTLSYPCFSSFSLNFAYYIYLINKKYLPLQVRTIIESFLCFPSEKGNGNSSINHSLNSNEKLHFILIYSLFLFPACICDHYLFSYIRLFYVLGRIYNCRRNLKEFNILFREVVFLNYLLENECIVDSSTINDHIFLHEDLSYLYLGPPKALDCYEPEWSFSSLKNPNITPNLIQTLFKNQMNNTIASMFKKTEKQPFILSGDVNSCIKNEFCNYSIIQFSVRVLSAFNSSCRYCLSSVIPILTLWDIEATSSLSIFLSNEFFTKKYTPCLTRDIMNPNVFPSTDDEIQQFTERISDASWKDDIKMIPHPCNVSTFSSIKTINGQYHSLPPSFSYINKKILLSGNINQCFGLVTDYKGNPHLLSFCCFFMVDIHSTPYYLCVCQEIPISFILDNPYSQVFRVNNCNIYNLKHTIISMDRINPVIFVDEVVSDNAIGFCDKTFIAQYSNSSKN